MISPGQKCKVIIETPDGVVMDFDAYTVEIGIRTLMPERSLLGDFFDPLPSRMETSILLRGYNGGHFTFGKDPRAIVESMRTATEWKCDYCLQVNERKDKDCPKCGAVRSFLYD